MIRYISLIIFSLISNQIFCQVDENDSIKQKIVSQLETRLPESWQVISSTSTLELIYINSDGVYARGCCPKNFEIPREKKLLKWLKNDYLTAFYPTVMKISDTLKVEITFSPTWSEEKIDSIKNIQDSVKLDLKNQKVENCKNPYWLSNSSKQVIPFYSEKLNCSVFFERPSAFGGIFKVDYEYGIPRFINIDDEILIIEQMTGLILGIGETCFDCRCEGN